MNAKADGTQESFEYVGEFWLPESPERSYGGKLAFRPNSGVVLEINGILPFTLTMEVDVIHGLLPCGECTLFECRPGNMAWSKTGLAKQQFHPRIAVIGTHLTTLKEDCFCEISAGFDDLDSWVRFKAIREEFEPDQQRGSCYFDQNPALVVVVPDWNSTVVLEGGFSGSISQRAINLEHRSLFSVRPTVSNTLDILLDRIFEIRDFFTFSSWRKGTFKRLTSKTISGKTCGIYGRYPTSEGYAEIDPWMPVYLADLHQHFPLALTNWIQTRETVGTPRGLFVGLLQDNDQFIQLNFLALTQIAEALHRCREGGLYMPPDAYEALCQIVTKAIPSSVDVLGEKHFVPDSLRQSLKNRIHYGNQYSQRKRLTQLLEEIPKGSIQERFFGKIDQLVERVVRARNYLTHRDENSKHWSLTNAQMSEEIRRLKVLLQIHFLLNLGLAFSTIENIAQKNNWESFALR